MIRKITLTLLAAICILSADVFAQSSRLVAKHTIYYNTSWAPLDSAVYTYPTGAGGDYWDLANNRLPYDTARHVGWDGTNWIPYMRYTQSFDINGRIIERIRYQISGITVTNDDKTIYVRDGNGNVLDETSQDWVTNAWVNQYRTISTYDGNNNRLTQRIDNWSTTNNAWTMNYMYVYTYDGNNNMTSNVNTTYNSGTSQWDSTYRNVFHYINNLNDTSWGFSWSSGWQPGSRTIQTFNVNNLSEMYLNQNWVNNAWENSSQGYTLFITSSVSYGDSMQTWNTTTNSWMKFSRGRNTYDGNYNSLVYLWETYDTANNVYVNNYIDSATYNSFDQVTWTKKQKWDTTNHVWTGSYAYTDNLYYYELFTADVKTVQQSLGSMIVYPSPARSNVNISMKWNKPQDFVVAIYDIQGRIIRQWGEKATNEYKKNVPLAGIAPGTYILQVKGKDATVQEQFVIMD